jgi:hypothetical protein
MEYINDNMKNIIGFDDYLINEFGEVYSLKTKMYIKSSNNYNNYKVITLRKNGVKKQFRLHRLVAQAFLPNPYNKDQVNHIDGNKANNNLSNLEWATALENNVHAYKIKLKTGNKKGKLVVNLENGIFYNSAKEASLSANIKLGTFVGYLNGNYKNKTSYVYV